MVVRSLLQEYSPNVAIRGFFIIYDAKVKLFSKNMA